MATRTIALFCFKQIVNQKIFLFIFLLFTILLSVTTYNNKKVFQQQNQTIQSFQKKARESWEANPNKHPHRMAHFGSFAFRTKHALSIFDNGIENYAGNAVFLEAHKQNTINFSEASFSTGLLRFGDLTMAMLLQIVMPLLLFFLGFAAIAQAKENGTLKILLTQNISKKQLIIGNVLGLFAVSIVLFIPAIVLTILFVIVPFYSSQLLQQWLIINASYVVYFFAMASITICISAINNKAKNVLLQLLGIWLMLIIVLPKTIQAIGTYVYTTPSKIEFDMEVEKIVLQFGDSHNANDPKFKAIKDSVLKANNADSIQQLNFNYSGYQMYRGEELSANAYNTVLNNLYNQYQKQNKLTDYAAFINPLFAVKNNSMAFSHTNFSAYQSFISQAEKYRYNLAQTMNSLQMKYISNKKLSSTDKPYTIDKHHWHYFPDFKYKYQSNKTILKQQLLSCIALLSWLFISIGLIHFSSIKTKAI
jgi:ABC-2 type transport system permease protein